MKVDVAVVQTEKAEYPKKSPYNPSEIYPEYPFGNAVCEEKNHVYAAVRQVFAELNYDSGNFGKKEWNPLGFLIKPGMTVVLKPNF
nr:hypothetical protein [Pyrinomonadaceae bacterium]